MIANLIFNLTRPLFVAALLFGTVACGDGFTDELNPGGTGTSGSTSAALKVSHINCETVDNQLLLTGNSSLQYTAQVVSGGDWCTFAQGQTTRKGAFEPIVFVYTQRNMSTRERTATLTVDFSNGDHHEVSLTQDPYSVSASSDRDWAEQPQFEDNPNYIHVTHYTTLKGSVVRNYSICFDTDRRGSRWVAYPLHECYTKGNAGRNEMWGYDPQIPTNYQSYVSKGYGYPTYNGYDRGHQLPSADRQATDEMNAQTFYASNMTPQLADFNQKYWATLETKVRGYICSDTLYVVTGAHYATQKVTQDRQGDDVGLPSHYFKLLLRTRSGKSGKAIQDCSASDLKAIGFWLDHKANNGSPSASDCKSVAEIEKLTGFTFFPTIPDAVKQQTEPAAWNL